MTSVRGQLTSVRGQLTSARGQLSSVRIQLTLVRSQLKSAGGTSAMGLGPGRYLSPPRQSIRSATNTSQNSVEIRYFAMWAHISLGIPMPASCALPQGTPTPKVVQNGRVFAILAARPKF